MQRFSSILSTRKSSRVQESKSQDSKSRVVVSWNGKLKKIAMVITVLTAWISLYTLAGYGQVPPKPGPEHEKLKRLIGTWDVSSEDGSLFRGTMTWKEDLGGLWIASSLEADFGGEKYYGRGFDTYDPNKKKYISVWIDSMSVAPAVFEGNYDEAGNVLTMTADGPGPDGTPARYRIVLEKINDTTYRETMYMSGPNMPETRMFALIFKRRN
jgi:hypothetical protein